MFENSCLFETVIGACGLTWSDAGLTGVQLPEATVAKSLARLTRHGAQPVDAASVPEEIGGVIAALRAFLSGDETGFNQVRLDMHRHSAFEQEAYEALRKVAWGKTVTYGDLAATVGKPNGAQAIGMAMGRNSWPLIVPCHRVLGANGWLGGFSAPGGTVTKKSLLEREGVFPDGGQMALFE
ncbi:MAG: methylated-DNA--[protein]-cysteine S-methyltransferase [Hyphomonas sp.]|uniref:methylated-DNA--[protein]-cysteine S-methyltransferase n=1 Tax=Hyphomonas sp. TaxID=87 RepID=UPI003528428A